MTDADDETAFTVLDAYLDKIHAGQRPSKQDFLAAHPELAGALECLEALECLAPPVETDSERTLGFSGGPPARDERPAGDLGKFELLEELGRGGMGVVYKARQKDLGRIVALKMILGSHLAVAEVLNRFHDEARVAAAVQHPNITAVYDVGQLLGQPYIAIQYVGGPSLAQRLRQGPLPLETTARIVAAVARAVHSSSYQRCHPPRLEAVEHSSRRAGPTFCHRLRPGQNAARRQPPHHDGRDPGHAQLHGSRASRRARLPVSARPATSTAWGPSFMNV